MRRKISYQVIGLIALHIAYCASSSAQDLAPGSRPNLLLIVADDLGYLDLGTYGSEIDTPNIDRLAANGLVLTNFYSGPLCAPTRTMLMSGTDHHLSGMGIQTRHVPNQPGYEGFMNYRVMSLPRRLRAVGYHTYMAGKWHIGLEADQSPAARGFERSFALMPGFADHFADKGRATYKRDGVIVDELPDDFYSTVFYTDQMLEYIHENLDDGQPFFSWLAYTAPHWPMQALDEDLERQRGRYDEGYDVIRSRRFDKWKELGFAPADAELPEAPVDYVPWDSLSREEQAISARTMETYAAMVERLDAEIGRVLQDLDDAGVLDNTIVMFMSDNGAEGGVSPLQDDDQYDNRLENIGRRGSYRYLGPGWAEAGSAPFWLRKTFTAEGGIHVPAIVSAPALGVASGRRDDLLIAYDISATFVELAGASGASVSPDILAFTGRSFAGLLRGDRSAVRTQSDALGWEHRGQRAIRRGDWKAVWVTGRNGNDTWGLFNLADDPSERNDLSRDRPDVLAELLEEWDRYVAEYGVAVPVPETVSQSRVQ